MNCERILLECLGRIHSQNYPKGLLEILLVDGGSKDATIDVAKRFGAKVIHGNHPQNAEARRYVGIQHARNDIIVSIDSDNILPHKNWLKDMVQPFMEDKDIIAAFTKWYGFTADTTPIDQYYALLGGNDPITFYLGKNDRVPYPCDRLPRGAILVKKKMDYDIVKFDTDHLPAIGCNGFLIRREVASQLRYATAEEFFHIDVNIAFRPAPL